MTNWKILKEIGIPDHLNCLLRNLHAVQEAIVRRGHGTKDWFKIEKGVHQGCILSSCFFNTRVQFSSVTQSCPTLCDPVNCSPPGSSVLGNFPGKSAGVGCHFLPQGIFLTQGLNPGLPHWRQTLYRLNHQELFIRMAEQKDPELISWTHVNY